MEAVQRAGAEGRKSYKRRLLSYVLCMALVLGLAKPPPAKASFSLTAAAVGSVVAIFMASVGFTWAADNMDSPGFQDVMVREIREFLDEVHGGLDILSWVPAIAFQVTNPGHLSLSRDVVGKFVEFVGWFQTKFGFDDNSPVEVFPSTTGVYLLDGNFVKFGLKDVCIGQFLAVDSVYTLSNGVKFGLFSDGIYRSFKFFSQDDILLLNVDLGKYGAYYFLIYNPVNGCFDIACDCSKDGITISYPYKEKYNIFSIESAGGIPLVVNGSLLASQGELSVPDIDTMTPAQAYDLTIPGSVATDVPGILDNAVDLILEGSVPITGEVVDVADVPIEDTKTEVGDIALEDIQKQEKKLGAVFLSKFPFCIPWDLARAVQLLAAPAQTPRWEVDFFSSIDGQYGIDWKGDTTIVIDFSEFELLGQISRWTSTFMFVWMLIYNTKRLIMTA